MISSPVTSGPGGGSMIVGRYKLVNYVHNSGWDQVGKRPFLTPQTFCIKMSILRRQARDKHRKNSKKGGFPIAS